MAAPKPVVLLVEDEPAQREILRYNLEADGFAVVCAADGEEAMERLAEGLPDLILLDWMMPHVSGLEVCRRLKLKPETRNIPVIMLSSRDGLFDKALSRQVGSDQFLTKPFSKEELLDAIRAHVPGFAAEEQPAP